MSKSISVANQAELSSLRELSALVGNDLLLTQASTGNSSIKLENILWIKASGKWMADAIHEDIFIPLDLAEVKECVKQKADPAELDVRASIETAMHAVMPHRVVLHIHSVDTIAWAVRRDAPVQLKYRLDGLLWQWISYVPSGLPLAREIEKALSACADTNVLILGNHGLVIGGDDCGAVEELLSQVQQRLALCPRQPDPTHYAALAKIADGSAWSLPDDNEIHVLGTDAISRAILSVGLLYPCQLVFSTSSAPVPFRSVPYPDPRDQWQRRYRNQQFLIVERCGVIVKRTMTPAQRAMMSGLAQVVQRISSSAPLRYLTDEEIVNSSSTIARYRELVNSGRYSVFPLDRNSTTVKNVGATRGESLTGRVEQAGFLKDWQGSELTNR
jgi:rhamnose utilization protein RhaD (predicted bifunctional aldolase and dehydrogenase)